MCLFLLVAQPERKTALLLCLRNRLRLNIGLRRLDLRQIGIGMRPGIEEVAVSLRRFGVLALLFPGIGGSVKREARVRTFFEILFICIASFLIMSGANQGSSEYFQRRARILRWL